MTPQEALKFIEAGDLDALSQALEKGEISPATELWGYSLFCQATRRDKVDVARLMLEFGADGAEDLNALLVATREGCSAEMIELLLDAGASLLTKNESDYDALTYLLSGPAERSRRILARVDDEVSDEARKKIATDKKTYLPASKDFVLSLLEQKEMDFMLADEVLFAGAAQELEFLRYLLSIGKSPKNSDILVLAAEGEDREGARERVRLLVEDGQMDPDTGHQGMTALGAALYGEVEPDLELATWLVDHGADPFAPIDWAFYYGDPYIESAVEFAKSGGIDAFVEHVDGLYDKPPARFYPKNHPGFHPASYAIVFYGWVANAPESMENPEAKAMHLADFVSRWSEKRGAQLSVFPAGLVGEGMWSRADLGVGVIMARAIADEGPARVELDVEAAQTACKAADKEFWSRVEGFGFDFSGQRPSSYLIGCGALSGAILGYGIRLEKAPDSPPKGLEFVRGRDSYQGSHIEGVLGVFDDTPEYSFAKKISLTAKSMEKRQKKTEELEDPAFYLICSYD